jgi:hypothetical protein
MAVASGCKMNASGLSIASAAKSASLWSHSYENVSYKRRTLSQRGHKRAAKNYYCICIISPDDHILFFCTMHARAAREGLLLLLSYFTDCSSFIAIRYLSAVPELFTNPFCPSNDKCRLWKLSASMKAGQSLSCFPL